MTKKNEKRPLISVAILKMALANSLLEAFLESYFYKKPQSVSTDKAKPTYLLAVFFNCILKLKKYNKISLLQYCLMKHQKSQHSIILKAVLSRMNEKEKKMIQNITVKFNGDFFLIKK